jgi:quinol monooxygenase YgiN
MLMRKNEVNAMSEVLIIARFVASQGKEDQLKALLQGMLTPTRAEAGCERYELYGSDARGHFYLYETWENQAALDQHIATPHFRHLEQAVGELLTEPFEVNILHSIEARDTNA